MPILLLVRLQIRKSAAAGVTANGTAVASPRQNRRGQSTAGRPLWNTFAHRPFARPGRRLRCGLRDRSKFERFPVMLYHFSLRSRQIEPTSMPVNEDRPEIVDVGVSRSGLQQIAQAFKKTRRIVLGK